MAALLNWAAMQYYASLYDVAKNPVDHLIKVRTALLKASLTDHLNALKDGKRGENNPTNRSGAPPRGARGASSNEDGKVRGTSCEYAR